MTLSDLGLCDLTLIKVVKQVGFAFLNTTALGHHVALLAGIPLGVLPDWSEFQLHIWLSSQLVCRASGQVQSQTAQKPGLHSSHLASSDKLPAGLLSAACAVSPKPPPES